MNATASQIYVQFAYPWPAYAVAAGSDRHFAFSLAPGQTWRSDDRHPHDTAILAISQPNGVALVRVRNDDAWQLFGVMADSTLASLAPIEIVVSDGERRFAVAATSHQRQVIAVEELDDIFWFGSR